MAMTTTESEGKWQVAENVRYLPKIMFNSLMNGETSALDGHPLWY